MMIIKCKICNKEKSVKSSPSRISSGRGKYCSRKCSAIASKETTRIANTGRKLSIQTKEKLRQATLKQFIVKGHPNTGKHWKMNEDKKRNMVRIGKWDGEKNPSWVDGRSRLRGYPKEWNKELREKIRKRDKYTCQICGRVGNKSLNIHHIDYTKSNCNSRNLVTLCKGCHTKTNFKRKAWIRFFDKTVI